MVGFGIIYSKPIYVPNLPRWIWDMVRFGVICPKPDHDPNLPRHIWDMVEFGVLSVSNPTCPKFTQVDLGHGRIWYHIFQTYLCPKFT